LGRLRIKQGNYPAGIDFFERAIEIYQTDGFTRELPELYHDLGMAVNQTGNSEAALTSLRQSYDASASIGMINTQAEAALGLAQLYEDRGSQGEANYFLKKYIELHDSVFTLESHRQLAELEAAYEMKEQEQQIIQLEQQNEINTLNIDRSRYVIISMGGILIVILLFGILFIRQIQIRNQQRVLINQQRLFRSQMNPHFIFNSLTNIQHYIFNKDSLAAGKYLAIFAKLMRSILNNSRKEIITLREEIETIRQYLDLQKLRMEDKLDYEIIVDEALDPEITEIPPMLAQPFIENAIEHGIKNKEGRGLVSIRIKLDTDSIYFEVEDDGVGRKRAGSIESAGEKGHVSMAVSLTRSRLQNLWARKKPDYYFKIFDKQDHKGAPTGTLVRFKIPA
jgi:tetratricopeptide (TPR) repeat protein